MTDEYLQQIGQDRAQAFHDGFEAGKRVGAEVMRDAIARQLLDQSADPFRYAPRLAEDIRKMELLPSNHDA